MPRTTNYKFFIAIVAIFIVGLFVYSTKNIDNSGLKIPVKNSRLQVVTSFYPLYFFTTQIVLDKAAVYNITPAGAEPHDYEPTTRDIAKIEDSQLLVLNGGKLEAWGENIQNILSKKNTTIINVGETLINQDITENDNQMRDPHIWLDPVLAKKEVEIIAKNISTIDPTNSQFYSDNSKLLINKLENLNSQFKAGLNNCQKKDIITSHAAFGYLTREYNLNQITISGLSPDEEPSPKKLAEITKLAKENQINYIFFESLVSPKLANTIAQEIGAKTLVLNPIEGLTDEEIKNGKNYFTEMQNNLTNLKIALECL